MGRVRVLSSEEEFDLNEGRPRGNAAKPDKSACKERARCGIIVENKGVKMRFNPGDIVNIVHDFGNRIGDLGYTVVGVNEFETYVRQESYRNKQGKLTRNIYMTIKSEDGNLSYIDERYLRLARV